MRCAMAGNGGRSRRAQGACGCAMEAVISASPGILSAESKFHDRVGAMYYGILLKTGELRGKSSELRTDGQARRPILLGVASRRTRAPGGGPRRGRYLLS